MIDAHSLIKIAKKAHILPERLERDYVMSLILDGLSRCEKTKKEIIFKGGTCVHKCFTSFEKPVNPKQLDPYFTHGRFSSDIDLTVYKKLMSTDKLLEAFSEVADYVYQKHGLYLESLDFPMHFNVKSSKTNSRATLKYHGPLYLHNLQMAQEKEKRTGRKVPVTSAPTLKIDITADEKVVYRPDVLPIYHPYPNLEGKESDLQTRCYSLQGMFAEKVRSLFDRCSPRDLYDLHILYAHPDIKNRELEIGEAMLAKFRFKKMPLDLSDELLTQPKQNGHSLKDFCKDEWEHSLKQQVGALGAFEDYWDNEKFPKILNFARGCMQAALRFEKQKTNAAGR